MVKRFIALAFALGLSACGGSSPAAPSVLQVAGTWSGSITSNQVSGSGPASVTLAQSGTALSGTWSVTGPDGPNSGALTGTVAGTSVTMTLTPSDPRTCPYNATVNVAGNSMTGTYAAFNCSASASGGISLTKQ